MKKKKLAIIIAVTVAGNYFVPISGTLTAHAEALKVKKQVEASKSETGLEKNNITFYNIWGGKSVSVDFNTDTMKIEANRISGDLGNGNNTYLKLYLYNSEDKKLEINERVKDGSSLNLTSILNGKPFNYGDVIGIDFEENTNLPNINNIGNIGRNEPVYYEITKDGLVKYNGVNNSSIEIVNGWGTNAGEISFNPLNKTFSVSGYNKFLGSNGNDFLNISVYDLKAEKTIYKEMFKGNDNTSVLSNSLNGQSFDYGDVVKLSYDNKQGKIKVFNNEEEFTINKDSYYEITEKGLTPFKENLSVEPFDVLNGNKVNKGDIKGVTNKNSKVTVSLNGQNFEGESDSTGKFNIPVEDSKGFTPSTSIVVSTDGEVPITINPTAPKNLGIGKSSITLPDASLGTAENITFNPSTMKISSYGNAFLAQLVNSNNGEVKASVGNSNFGVYNSENNLNGASFNYGDIINIYEPEENYLSDGDVKVVNDGKEATINVNGTFASYKIEPQGLVKIENKNLSNVKAEYEGNSNIVVKGKTEANKEVTIFFGSSLNKSEEVKSDSNGDFKLEIPIANAEMGTQVMVYLNNENMQSTLVSYNNEKFNTSNKIEIINNANFPVIDMSFNLINNEINTKVNQYYKTYAGVFYGNKMNISLLSKDGSLIKSVTSKNLAEIQDFSNSLNGLKFTEGDILKIKYDKNFGDVNVLENKKEIGNTTGNTEYFEITNKGLVNVTDKFAQVNPLEILNGNKVTEATLSGQAGKDEEVTVNVNGQKFTGKTDSTGNYSINIKDDKGFSLNTNIEVLANGYLETTINPTYENNMGLQNSSINLYTNGYTIELSNLGSKIGFDINNKTITVNNYEKSFGNGKASLFNFGLYSESGEKIFEKDFNNGSTKSVSDALNGKNFNYGDVIELSFNPSVNKPVVLNGNNVIGNITGEKEYFKITKVGLVRVNVKENNVKDNTKDTYIKLANKNEISSYANTLNANIQKINTTDLKNNIKNENMVLASRFINTVGENNLEEFYGESKENANFLNWVLNNNTAMSEFLGGPNPNEKYMPEGQPSASYIDCIKVWSNIWNTYENSHAGFNLKLAIAVALTNGQPIMSFPAGVPVGSPVERYNIFESLNADGGMLPEFETLGVSQLCFITNTDITNDQIKDIRNVMLQNHNGLILGNGMLENGAYTINYNTRNPHTGASVFGNNFYGKNPNIYSVWYDGGVCGATGRLGADVDKVFGVPATQTPQPGHNAFIYYNGQSKSWQIGNAIDGWANTYGADMSSWSSEIAPNSKVASYTILYQNANNGTLGESNNYKYLAGIQNSYDAKLNDLKEAIKINKLNLGAWIDLVNLEKGDKNMTIEDYNNLSNNIIDTFKEYPMQMYDLLLQLKNTYMSKGTESDFNNYVDLITNELKSEVKNQMQSKIASCMLTEMQSDGLYKGNTELGESSIIINNVWNYNIANIGFNPENSTITVNGGGTYTNPYGKSEAFSISLEDSSGKVLKTVEINQSDSNAKEEIAEALNGVKYSYGDKIIIDYKTSSIISVNNVIMENGQKENLQIKQSVPKTQTLYITKNGLSLSESKKIQNNSGVIKPTNNLAKEDLINTINIAKKDLESNEYTEASNEYLKKMITNAEEVAQDVDSNKEQYKEMTTLLKNTLNKIVKKQSKVEEKHSKVEKKDSNNSKTTTSSNINKENLIKTINIAKEDLKSNEYTKASNEYLKTMISNAEEIVQNKNSSVEEYKGMTELLKNYSFKIIQKRKDIEALINEISIGENKLKNGTNYTVESQNELKDALTNGENIVKNTSASEAQVLAVIKNIKEKIISLEVKKKESVWNQIWNFINSVF
ncbi:MAG: hypothetical protein ACRC28_08730 [Clostridium sp.]|uniref:hypothetical protein n=1 Tax=Clostridium sp. TaxID=1506 RepID=UPI003F3B70A9